MAQWKWISVSRRKSRVPSGRSVTTGGAAFSSVNSRILSAPAGVCVGCISQPETHTMSNESSPALTVSQSVKVRACSLVCIAHPEWGTWGVMEDHGDWFDILGDAGSRILSKEECDESWKLVA
jgi:hypothetical protein